ncbi:MAG: zf-HC2 domain-containing protein [Eubacteriales bacterium]|nr:zf-HC2 domain-containing protein [Eubacteriales bacterium]
MAKQQKKGTIYNSNKRLCRKVCSLISPYIDGETGLKESAFLEEHIAHCHECRTIFDHMKKTSMIIAGTEEIALPPDFGKKLHEAIIAEKNITGTAGIFEPSPSEGLQKTGYKKYISVFIPAAAAIALFIIAGTVFPGLPGLITGRGDESASGSSSGYGLTASSGTADASYGENDISVKSADMPGDTEDDGRSYVRDFQTESESVQALGSEGAGSEAENAQADRSLMASGNDLRTGEESAAESMIPPENNTDMAQTNDTALTVTMTDSPDSKNEGDKYTLSLLYVNMDTFIPREGDYIYSAKTALSSPDPGKTASSLKEAAAAAGGELYDPDEYSNIPINEKSTDSDIIVNIKIDKNRYTEFAAFFKKALSGWPEGVLYIKETDASEDVRLLEYRIDSMSGCLSYLMKNPLLNAADILNTQADRNKAIDEYETLKENMGCFFIGISVQKDG